MLEEELGRPIEEVFEDFPAEPVAAASLAQVYRAKLRGSGDIVAVKVQRPRILETVSKDLYVLRRAAEVYQGLIDRFAPQQARDCAAHAHSRTALSVSLFLSSRLPRILGSCAGVV